MSFWADQEDPFQLLACMFELSNAMKNGETKAVDYCCNFPVHQDGSCNGLQHYAALGRDEGGGTAVNLTPGERPADVYTKVLERVLAKLAITAAEGDEMSQILVETVSYVLNSGAVTSALGSSLNKLVPLFLIKTKVPLERKCSFTSVLFLCAAEAQSRQADCHDICVRCHSVRRQNSD